MSERFVPFNRDQQLNATLLLDAAQRLGYSLRSVRTISLGFLVPNEVFEAALGNNQPSPPDAPTQEKKSAPKKKPATDPAEE